MHLRGILVSSICSIIIKLSGAQEIGGTELVHDFITIDYDWPNEQDRNEAIADGTYIVENNVITGIKLYGLDTYVTVSRWLPGVPSTMNKVIQKEGKSIMQPFPSWEMQQIDNCDAFQFTQSMEIDPTTGHMWVIDAGRRNIWEPEPINNCPPKLWVVELRTGAILDSYTFPDDVLSYTSNFVNDIVLDLVHNFAYMSDVGTGSTGHRGGLVSYDMEARVSYRLEHSSMLFEPNASDINVNGKIYRNEVPIDGIGLSPDVSYIFYCPLGGYNLWRIPSAVARAPAGINLDDVITLVGSKVSQSDGIAFGDQSLYYAAMGSNSVYKWEYTKDMDDQNLGLGDVALVTETEVARDDVKMIWADTFGWDDQGWLWYICNQLPPFRARELDFTGTDPNFFIWKVYTGEKSYLPPSNSDPENSGSALKLNVMIPAVCYALFIILKEHHLW